MHFNATDRVVVPQRPVNADIHPYWVADMDTIIGVPMTVISVELHHRCCYCSADNGISFNFDFSWLSPLETIEIPPTPYSHVINKIKSMDKKRKELGYAF